LIPLHLDALDLILLISSGLLFAVEVIQTKIGYNVGLRDYNISYYVYPRFWFVFLIASIFRILTTFVCLIFGWPALTILILYSIGLILWNHRMLSTEYQSKKLETAMVNA